MRYPPDVQKHVDYLETYEIDETLEKYNIIHMYPKGLAATRSYGFVDSRKFILWGYSTGNKKRRNLGHHDGLSFARQDSPRVDIVRIFADGSTFIRFCGYVKIGLSQEAMVWQGGEK